MSSAHVVVVYHHLFSACAIKELLYIIRVISSLIEDRCLVLAKVKLYYGVHFEGVRFKRALWLVKALELR